MSYLGVSAELHYLSLPLGMTHCAALEVSALNDATMPSFEVFTHASIRLRVTKQNVSRTGGHLI